MANLRRKLRPNARAAPGLHLTHRINNAAPGLHLTHRINTAPGFLTHRINAPRLAQFILWPHAVQERQSLPLPASILPSVPPVPRLDGTLDSVQAGTDDVSHIYAKVDSGAGVRVVNSRSYSACAASSTPSYQRAVTVLDKLTILSSNINNTYI
jgi:hypothetical protein